jgi:hypothetical protein
MAHADRRRTLITTRNAALTVHGALLDATIRSYERRYGRIGNGVEALRLATESPEFAWLQPLTALLAALDEALYSPEPDGLARGERLARSMIDLLRADENGGPFRARYLRELQTSPDVALIAAMARPSLQSMPTQWT